MIGAAVVLFGDPNDRFDHIWEAAATAPPLAKRVIHLRRHEKLPGIFIEKGDNRLLDLLQRDDVAVADKHDLLGFGPWVAASGAMRGRRNMGEILLF
jgi:hypothetical protein